MDRKEFKILSPVMKEELGIINLIRQIEAGEGRYDIEGKDDLSISVLRKHLQTFCEENSATELYQDLGQKEETLEYKFLMQRGWIWF